MKRAIGSIGVAALLIVAPQCVRSEDPAPASCPSDFDVEREIFHSRCSTAGCHVAGLEAAGGLDLLSADVASRLVDVPAKTTCGGLRIDGDNPHVSVLLDKVSPDPECGLRMPLGGTPLADMEMQCLRDWVARVAQHGPPDGSGGSPTTSGAAGMHAGGGGVGGEGAGGHGGAGGNGEPGIVVLAEIYYDPPGGDSGYEWVKLHNSGGSSVDLSAYSLGWGGEDYTYGLVQLAGTIAAGECFVVGGPSAGGAMVHQPVDLNPDLQNADTAADGVALFGVPAAQVDPWTVPLAVTVYGAINESGLIDETGAIAAVDAPDAASGMSLQATASGWTIAVPAPDECP